MIDLEGLLRRVLAYILNNHDIERNLLMAISANVQKLIDDVQQNSDLVKSVIAGQAIMTKQIADLKDAAAVLEAGAVASAEDVAGINSSITALEDTNKALGVAVPANTPEAVPADNPTPTT